jgi:hypothetical protein
METVGILKVKGETKQVSDKFKSRELVLTVEPGSPYPQHVTFQLTQDKCSILDSYQIGEELKVLFNLKGRAWTSPQGEEKYFNTLEAWRVEKVSGTSVPASPAKTNVAGPAPAQTRIEPIITSSGADDDLPF